jgi:hypothetical protein
MIRQLTIPRRLERLFFDISNKLIGVIGNNSKCLQGLSKDQGGKVIKVLPNKERCKHQGPSFNSGKDPDRR